MTVRRLTLAQRAKAPLSPNARLRCEVVFQLLAELPAAQSFLEMGCGQGALATLLSQCYEYVGYEPDATSYSVARRRLARCATATVVNAIAPETPNRLFDLVGAFEVLEHQEDDRAALEAWVRWLRPGGHVLLSVPAHQERFAAADRVAGHFRRYSRTDLLRLTASLGLVYPSVSAYGFPLGYALEWGRNRLASRRTSNAAQSLEQLTAASGRKWQPAEQLAALIWIGTLPFRFLQRPFTATDLGAGFVLCAQRPR